MAEVWRSLVASAVTLRRELHRRPEVAWAETATARTIRDELDRLGIPWRACAGTGTVATLAPEAPGRHVALRADIDAMPISETSGVEHASRHDGVMHACGHDGHIATLFASTWWLRAHEQALPGPVSLLFQPAEEGGHGAKHMIEDGALAGGTRTEGPVEVVFGWHNWPAIGFGAAVCPDGAVMSANGTFTIEVLGRGGHASQPEATRDPVLAAAAVTVALQQVVARRLPPQQAAVVAVTSIVAPSAPTVTPDRAEIAGSIRVADTDQRDVVFALIDEVARDTARAHGCEATTTPAPRYGATVNHPRPAAELRSVLETELGERWRSQTTPVPVMASEDFSYYLDELPGAFALIGADDGRGHDVPCHSGLYDFNDALIDPVARMYARLAGVPVPDDLATDATTPRPMQRPRPDDLNDQEDATWT